MGFVVLQVVTPRWLGIEELKAFEQSLTFKEFNFLKGKVLGLLSS